MTRGRAFALTALMCASAFGASPAAAATTIAVTPNTADSTATCSASPCPNLRSAIGYANTHAATTLQLAAGKYSLSLGELILSANSTTILGKGSDSTHIVQTTTGARVLEIGSSAGLVLESLEVTGGNLVVGATADDPEADGGGITDAGTLSLSGVLVDRNSATGGDGADGTSTAAGGDGAGARGGGIYQASGASTLMIQSSSIVDNTAAAGTGGSNPIVNGTLGAGTGGFAEGGGVYTTTVFQAFDSTFAGNLAAGGDGGDVNTTNAVFAGDPGFGDGGGINATSSLLDRVTIANNTATGGLQGVDQANSSFDGRGSTADGGGLNVENSATVFDSTLFGNSASTPNAIGSAHYGLSGVGGGIAIDMLGGHAASLRLFSDTIDANTATSGGSSLGGDLYLAGNAPSGLVTGEFRDTIIAAGQDAATGKSQANDCFYEGDNKITDDGYNLDDAAVVGGSSDQCGLSTANHSLLGANPQLAALAANGGLTQTMALGGTSAALSAGGECLDPTTHDASGPDGYGPLRIDQRSLPRANPCDIGAFEHQVSAKTVNTSAPTISGTPSPGHPLTCNPGVWSGTGLTYSYQWRKDGTAIEGATGPSYLVRSGDVNDQLDCVVTAAGVSGTASAISAAVTVHASGGGGGGGTLTPGKLSIPPQTIVIGSNHRAEIKLKCTGERPCVGVIRITVTQTPSGDYIATVHKKPKPKPGRSKHKAKHLVVLARGTFTIDAGKKTTITIKVLNGGANLVHAHGHMKATIRVVATGVAKPITKVVTIKAARARRD